MPINTRQNPTSDFEHSLVEALKKKNVVETISNLIITTITAHFSEKFQSYDDRISNLEAEIQRLNSQNCESDNNSIEERKQKQKEVEKKLDNIQQRLKNDNLRLMQIPEAEGEDIREKVKNIFKDKMNAEITESDIVSVYRVGKRSENKPRHTIVTFRDNVSKMKVFNKKKSLKGSRIVIKEDLTATRLDIMKTASEQYGFRNVWSVNGNIFAKTENGVERIN